MSRFDWDEKRFERVLQLASAESQRFLSAIPERDVTHRASLEQLRERLGLELTEEGLDDEKVIRELIEGARDGLLGSVSPRFFGFVIGGSMPVALAADWLTSVWDQNAGLYAAAPAPSVCEEVAARWLLEVLRLPETSGVAFVTGGQMANTTCLAAARHRVLADAGWDVERDGLQGAPRVRVLVPDEAHATIFSALRLIGLGASPVRIATDFEGRMRPEALRNALREGEGPAIVCAQAGNVNTGSFDPLGEVIAIAHESDAWVHVDGAFGLWARVSPETSPLVEGVEEADSWATDAHKWLNVPYDCGIAIVKDRAAHLGATSVRADYLIQAGPDSDAPRDPLDWTPEFSRRGRGLPVYAALRWLGRSGLRELIERGCSAASRIASELRKVDGIRIVNEVVLNQVLVDFDVEDSKLHDGLVDRVVRRIQQDGRIWLSGSRWKGRAVIRVSVSNWATGQDEALVAAQAIADAWKSVSVE
ncbi:MAG: aminotransferase class V-fold PLP-dependent enzyme [Acidobacteria bacterium]|nr:aminotransferase class V-fold PLP-dependent enzyme [Acidobacteriota bacterium]